MDPCVTPHETSFILDFTSLCVTYWRLFGEICVLVHGLHMMVSVVTVLFDGCQ